MPGTNVLYNRPSRLADLHRCNRNPPLKHLKIAFYDTEESRKSIENRIASANSPERRKFVNDLLGFDLNEEWLREDVEYVHYRSQKTTEKTFVFIYHNSMHEFFMRSMGENSGPFQRLLFNAEELHLSAARKRVTYLSQSSLKREWSCFNLPDVKQAHKFLHYASMN